MKLTTALKPDQINPLLPVLLTWLWVLLQPVMVQDHADWSLLWPQSGLLLLQFLPLLLAQALLGWWLRRPARSQRSTVWVGTWWILGMLVYPALWLLPVRATWLQFGVSDWLLALGLSLLYLLHVWVQQQQPGRRSRWRWLWSLDAVLLLLLVAWTLGWSLLLTSHPPGLAQQPIPVRVNWSLVMAQPLGFLHYLWQFSLLAALMFGCYWLNRYWLIRRILATQGLLPFVLISLSLMLLCYPLLATLLLQLPMNQVEVPAVPAGSQNPFDWYNLNFMFIQWLITTPLILAFDRQQQESTLAQIQHQQVRTELLLLQQQINPHFLFNTLNNLYALCLLKSDDAPKLILQLADLLRYVVYQGKQSRVSLRQELDYLQHYLALQQLRVRNKISLTVDFPDDAAGYQLPPLLLIMLVENAYKHGVENSGALAQVDISAQVRQGTLYFVCCNSRPQPDSTATTTISSAITSGGIGLENLRRRLQLLYANDFVLQSGPDGKDWRAELQLKLELL